MITYCECIEKQHEKDCSLGKRLKIKYSPAITKVWDSIGAKEAEELIDEIMELI